MPIYTVKPGHDSIGPIFHVQLTLEGRSRIFCSCNHEQDAKEIANVFNAKVQKSQSILLTLKGREQRKEVN